MPSCRLDPDPDLGSDLDPDLGLGLGLGLDCASLPDCASLLLRCCASCCSCCSFPQPSEAQPPFPLLPNNNNNNNNNNIIIINNNIIVVEKVVLFPAKVARKRRALRRPRQTWRRRRHARPIYSFPLLHPLHSAMHGGQHGQHNTHGAQVVPEERLVMVKGQQKAQRPWQKLLPSIDHWEMVALYFQCNTHAAITPQHRTSTHTPDILLSTETCPPPSHTKPSIADHPSPLLPPPPLLPPSPSPFSHRLHAHLSRRHRMVVNNTLLLLLDALLCVGHPAAASGC